MIPHNFKATRCKCLELLDLLCIWSLDVQSPHSRLKSTCCDKMLWCACKVPCSFDLWIPVAETILLARLTNLHVLPNISSCILSTLWQWTSSSKRQQLPLTSVSVISSLLQLLFRSLCRLTLRSVFNYRRLASTSWVELLEMEHTPDFGQGHKVTHSSSSSNYCYCYQHR